MMPPEKLRKALERTVKELTAKENVYGVALFGSWSRGDAEASSDVDLLILDRNDFAYEYVERMERIGFLIDLNHVPRRWIQGQIPPEIDQKLYESQILYDRDWAMANTKVLMTKSYSSPERIDIRTDAHVVDSDIYLSRATSALSRHDFRSSHLFATVAYENALKVLIETTLQPLSNSRFIEKAESASSKLGMHDLFEQYTEMTEFENVDAAQAKERMRIFQKVWNDVYGVVSKNPRTVESAHFKVKKRLDYYLNASFLHGLVQRANTMVDTGKTVEAAHYIATSVLDLVENYAWLKSLISRVKIDYTTLIRALEDLEGKESETWRNITEILDLNNIDNSVAAKNIKQTRDVLIKIRQDKKLFVNAPR